MLPTLNFIFLCLILFSAQGALAENDVLPTPPQLQDDVKFWETIFSKYSPEQCVFHDEEDLRVTYYVTHVPKVQGRRRNHILMRHIKSIRLALKELAMSLHPHSKLQRQIWDAIPEDWKDKKELLEASERVRCQRGVDLRPSFERSKKFLPMIREVLKSKDLPEDLAYLPHLESGYDNHARSRVGARGLWQFMPHSARAEGLKVKQGLDKRIDPKAATDAATDYLASMYLRTRSWPLAITSYNYGPNGIMRAFAKFGSDYIKFRNEHESRIFGFAARNYYPSFLAVRNVAQREERRLVMQSSQSKELTTK